MYIIPEINARGMYGESNVNRITEWDEDLKKVEVEK